MAKLKWIVTNFLNFKCIAEISWHFLIIWNKSSFWSVSVIQQWKTSQGKQHGPLWNCGRVHEKQRGKLRSFNERIITSFFLNLLLSTSSLTAIWWTTPVRHWAEEKQTWHGASVGGAKGGEWSRDKNNLCGRKEKDGGAEDEFDDDDALSCRVSFDCGLGRWRWLVGLTQQLVLFNSFKSLSIWIVFLHFVFRRRRNLNL